MFSIGDRPKIEELKIKDDVKNERFQTVKQLIEACWHEKFEKRPTMESVLSCFVVDEENTLTLIPLYGK